MTANRLPRWIIFLAASSLIIGGCGDAETQVQPPPEKPTPTTRPISQPPPTQPIGAPPTNTPSSLFLDTEVDEPSPGAVAEGELSRQGPWWVFSTEDGLWAVNSDGTGLKRISSQEFKPPFNNQVAASPQGPHVAFLSGRDWIFDVTLRIVELPWPTMITEKALTSDLSEPSADVMPGDASLEAIRAIVEIQSMAWSPDGRYLAFMGAINGPTSDLYVYSLERYEEVQLTDGPSQGIQPVWSPDGKYIVHGGVSSLGTGAGYGMEGFWAARADDSGITTLFDPSNTGGQDVIGWIDDRTFVVNSWDAGCGPTNLRTYNIETGESHVLWEHTFQTVAMDPIHHVAVLGVTYDYEGCNPDQAYGIYVVPGDGSPSHRILDEFVNSIIWSPEAQLFLVRTEYGFLAIDSLGQYVDLDVPPGANSFPAVAPGTRDLAWTGDGLWIGPFLGSIDNPPTKISNQSTYNATWDPSGQYVLFFGPSGLYVAQRPSYQPRLVAEGLDNRNGFSAWVMP